MKPLKPLLILILFTSITLSTHAQGSYFQLNAGELDSSIARKKDISQTETTTNFQLEQVRLKLGHKLTSEKKANLFGKLEKLKDKQVKQDTKKLIQKLKKQKQESRKAKKELVQEVRSKRQQLKKSGLSKKEKKKLQTKSETLKSELKNEARAQKDSLKKINEQLKQDLEEVLVEKLTSEEREQIEQIEPNYLYGLEEDASIPNDSEFANQINLQQILNSKFEILNSSSSAQTVVAVIDTGIDYNHPDLQGNFWISKTCVDENNELIETGCPKGGYDFVDNDPDPFPDDDFSHGTSVAGIIGATTNNNLGIASLSNNQTKLMALRVAEDGLLELQDIIRAIYFAVNNGAQIINMSFGDPIYSKNLKTAIAYAEENNVIVVAAAGNWGMDNDTNPIYPASYDLENVISVAALDSHVQSPTSNVQLALASSSNYGANSVDLAAPGVDVLTTVLGDEYGYVSGTSFSASFVSAAFSKFNTRAELLTELASIEKLKGKIQKGKVLILGEDEALSAQEENVDEDSDIAARDEFDNPFVQMLEMEREHLGRLKNDLERAGDEEEKKRLGEMIEYVKKQIIRLEVEVAKEEKSMEERTLTKEQGSMTLQSVISFSGNGFGIKADPYEITNCEQLQEMENNLYADYELVNDVDCFATSGWNNGAGFDPVGNISSGRFEGTFDGNDYVISNLFINRPSESYIGLFGYTYYHVSITNVGLENVDVTGKDYVGGLVGNNYYSYVTFSYATGNVSGGSYVGGLVGNNNYYSYITSSYATGNVSGSSYHVGGLVGDNFFSRIINSYATGNVDGGDYCVGGLVGNSYYGTITNSYATGNARGDNLIVGGLVGRFFYSRITNSYATGSVSSNGSDYYVGGLVGHNNNISRITNSYYDIQTSNQTKGVGSGSSEGVFGKTTDQMKQQATFVDWDFVDTWKIKEGNDYPKLQWQLTFIDPTTYDFNQIETGQESAEQIFTITNTSSTDLNIYSIYLNDSINFKLNLTSGSNPCNITSPILTPNSSCTFGIKFTPYYTGSFAKALIIDSDASDNSHREIILRGTSGMIGELAYFKFSTITDQTVNVPFIVTISAKDGWGNTITNFTSEFDLWSSLTEKYLAPSSVQFNDGTWTGAITLYRTGENMHLAGTGRDNKRSQRGESNRFDVFRPGAKLTSQLSGIVTNANKKPLKNVKVYLLKNKGDNLRNAIAWQTSDTNGYYRFRNAPCGEYYLFSTRTVSILKNILTYKETDLRSVKMSCDQANTRNIMLASHCSKGDKNPVLLVPGIMGSDEKWHGSVYPTLPKAKPAKAEDLIIHDYAGEVGWSRLKSKLVNAGYVKDCTIFEVPYDWREDLNKAWVDYLRPAIDYAKLKSGRDKVDIVAHSMGGLLTRAYIQSSEYNKRQDVDKFAMVGTPNQGAALAYYIWAAGDSILADETRGGTTGWAKYFYTNTLHNIFKKMGSSICRFKYVYSDTPIFCDQRKIKQFLRKENMYSIKQLMPVYDNPLYSPEGNFDIRRADEENTFLKALNGEKCISGKNGKCAKEDGAGNYEFTSAASILVRDNSQDATKVETKIFMGKGQETIKAIKVNSNDQLTNETQTVSGDGTVTQESALIEWLNNDKLSSKHARLINIFKKDLTNFINN